MRALLAEDHPTFRKRAEQALVQAAHDTIGAYDGARVDALLATDDCDVRVRAGSAR